MIMTNWQTKKLGDIATIKRGGSPRPIQDYLIDNDQEGYSWLKIGDVPVGSRYIYETSVKIKPEGLKKTTLVKKGEFILSNSMSFGRPYIMMTDACIHDGWLALQDIDQSTDKNFLYYLLASEQMQNKFKNYSAGSGVLNLKKETVQEIDFKSPEKPEQERIVGVLEVWDEYIEKLEQKIALKEQLKKGLMQQLLTGKHRLPSFSEKWIVRKMGEFAKESRVKEGDNDVHKRLTVRLHLKGVEARGVRGTEAVDSTQYYRRSAGQLIYGKQNIFKGSIGVVPALYDGYASSQDIPSFDIEEAVANVYYIYYYLSRKSIYEWLENFAGGSGSKRLHTSEFYNIKIQLPSLEEQDAIVEVLQLALKEIETLKKHRDVLTKQKKYLLKNLITGTIRTPEDLKSLDTSRLERSAL